MADRLLVLQHLDCEGPDLIADLALERGLAVEVFRISAAQEAEPGES